MTVYLGNEMRQVRVERLLEGAPTVHVVFADLTEGFGFAEEGIHFIHGARRRSPLQIPESGRSPKIFGDVR